MATTQISLYVMAFWNMQSNIGEHRRNRGGTVRLYERALGFFSVHNSQSLCHVNRRLKKSAKVAINACHSSEKPHSIPPHLKNVLKATE